MAASRPSPSSIRKTGEVLFDTDHLLMSGDAKVLADPWRCER